MTQSAPKPPIAYMPELILLLGTACWGGSYWVMHTALQFVAPTVFVGLRFGVAAVLMLCFVPGVVRKIDKHIVMAGVVTGIAGFGGQLPQTWGLEYITISQSAFLTALYVPTVPLISWLIFRQRPELKTWCGVLIAFVGMTLLAVKKGFSINFGVGDFLTLFSAISIAFEVVLISKFSNPKDILALTFMQMIVISALAFISMPIAGDHFPPLQWNWTLMIAAVGVVSVIIQFSMNWGQQFITPSKAAVIYATEPVWGGLFGRMAGDRVGPLALLGGLFVIAGIIVSEWPSKKRAS